MRKLVGMFFTIILCMLAVCPVFAAENVSGSVPENIIIEIQSNISTDDVQSWTENSDASMNFAYITPVYSTIGVSENSNTLIDTLQFINQYNIPVVTSDGDCLGVFTVTSINGKWEIAAYTIGLDFVAAFEQLRTDSSCFIEIPQLSGDFGFLTMEDNEELYHSISSKTMAASEVGADEILSQIKLAMAVNNTSDEGTGIVGTSHTMYLWMAVVILFGATIFTVYLIKCQKKQDTERR